MPQKDFILREIEKIGAMLRMMIRRLFEWSEDGEQENAFEHIATELAIESNVEFEELVNLKKEDFTAYFDKNKGYNATNIELLADFFAHLSRVTEEPKANKYRLKAIDLYAYVDEITKTFSIERAGKMQAISHLKG
jgi:hypothetical protein